MLRHQLGVVTPDVLAGFPSHLGLLYKYESQA